MRTALRLLTALVLLAVAARPAAAAVRRYPAKPVVACLPDASYNTLMSLADDSLYANFVWAVKALGLGGELRRAARGRVILAPTNAVVVDWAARLGLLNLHHDPQKLRALLRDRRRMAAFRAKMAQFVGPRDAVAASVVQALGCGGLIVPTLSVDRPLAGVPPAFIEDMKVRAALRQRQPAGAAAAGAAPAAEVIVPAQPRFTVLGQGYNALRGFPSSWAQSGIDPGHTMVPVVMTPADQVTEAGFGPACSSTFASNTYLSQRNFTQGQAFSIGLGVDYMPVPGVGGALTSVAFAVNSEYSTLTATARSTGAATTIVEAAVRLGGFAFASSPATFQLHPSFVAYVSRGLELVDAPSEAGFIRSFIDYYGTHYVKKALYGGQAKLIVQSSLASVEELRRKGLSVGGAVSVAYQGIAVTPNGSVTTNSSDYQAFRAESKTFETLLYPSSVPLRLTAEATSIDCAAYTQALRAATQASPPVFAPINYDVVPLTDLFIFPGLFPGLPQAQLDKLPRLAQKIEDYILGCKFSNGQCPVVPTECAKGSFPSDGTCRSCFSSGPTCNPAGTDSCTATQCVCNAYYEHGPLNRCERNKADKPPPSNGGCFPAAAHARLADGRELPLSALRAGDRVLAGVDAGGAPVFSEVYMWGHRDPRASASFVELVTAGGAALRLTPDHHLPVADEAAWASPRELPASDVAPGLWVRLVSPDGTSTPDRVAAMRMVQAAGLYNPYTLAGGIVVDGVLASCHSGWVLDGLFRALGVPLPAGYQAVFAPLRALYRVIGPARAEALQAAALPLLHSEAPGTAPTLAAAAGAAAALVVTAMMRRSARM